MKLSEAIKLLQETLDKHGDGPLWPHDYGEYISVEESQFSHEIVPRKTAEGKIRCFEWIMIEE